MIDKVKTKTPISLDWCCLITLSEFKTLTGLMLLVRLPRYRSQ